MSVPDHRHIVQAVWDQQPPVLNDEGIGEFTERCVAALHVADPRWGHLRKRPGQTQYRGHAANAALYLSDIPGKSVAVDIIRHGDPTITGPRWLLDIPRYSASDWFAPDDATAPPPTQPPPNVDPVWRGLQQIAEIHAVVMELKARYLR